MSLPILEAWIEVKVLYITDDYHIKSLPILEAWIEVI